MTIDEAITHAREVANEQRKDNDNCEYKAEYGCKGCADYYSKPCIECTEEHEQLAEWLEELKAYRAHIISRQFSWNFRWIYELLAKRNGGMSNEISLKIPWK